MLPHQLRVLFPDIGQFIFEILLFDIFGPLFLLLHTDMIVEVLQPSIQFDVRA